jgi:hypothetical protein
MSSSGDINLSGLFDIQRNYLTGIDTNDPLLQTKVANIKNQLNLLNSSFNNIDKSNDKNTVNYQHDMIKIVDAEKERLLLKKQQVDSELDSKKRGIMMNESYRERFQQYTRMVIVIIFTLAIFIALIFIGSTFTFIPDYVITVLSLIVLIGGIFYAYFILVDVNARDKINYSELDLNGPYILSPEEIKKKSENNAKQGILFDSMNLGTCVGENCCSDGLTWDQEKQQCVSMSAASCPAPSGSTSAVPSNASSSGSTSAVSPSNASSGSISAVSPSIATSITTTAPSTNEQFININDTFNTLLNPNSVIKNASNYQ